ncbi:hypothetical protein KPL47_02610 [Clostridium estertheticum]|uniref:hypothetical protein n=1 Tax=Clostridium estertheticum TaxID=238834 RepID=UPI001C0C8668|nr:hypothetical protein [Clostridium estertheticum]MBU3175254.1 hypothetical protein [Clostridium estertheticum]
MDILQIFIIMLAIAKMLEGINLISNTSKTLVKFSTKLLKSSKKTTFYNKNIRESLSRNFSGTSKLLGITDIILGIIGAIISINVYRIVNSNSTILIILFLFGLPVAIRFIVGAISKHIRE